MSPRTRSAADMINDCFRHQHPEAYGREEVARPALPAEIRYGTEYVANSLAVIPEESMGHPAAVPVSVIRNDHSEYPP